MRSRGSISFFVLLTGLALLATACSSAVPDEPAISRSVGDEVNDWDVDQAILRTEVIEANMDHGLTRGQAACMIDTLSTDNEYPLDEIDDIDFTGRTGDAVGSELAGHLADALVSCGQSLRDQLIVDIPGTFSIPSSHSTESECVVNSYVEAWRSEYADAFGTNKAVDAELIEMSVDTKLVEIVAGCDAGAAVVLGASHEGHADTHALSTLEWICLAAELTNDDFMPAFPFPEEPGDALGRMGSDAAHSADFCREWVGAKSDAERAEVESRYR